MQTYHMDKRTRHHRRFWTAVGVLLVLVLAFFINNRLQHTTTTPTTIIHNSPPVSTNYDTNSASKVHIDKPLFTLDLPSGWQSVPPAESVNVPSYTFRSPSTQAQQLELFIDNIPSTMAVNRVVLVNAKGAGLDHENVSDNCTTFTPAMSTQTGVVTGKWQGTSFLCDEGNYERDVVGITSGEGINVVTLTGPTAGTHKIFIAYTNNNINPDFSALYNALESFTLK